MSNVIHHTISKTLGFTLFFGLTLACGGPQRDTLAEPKSAGPPNTGSPTAGAEIPQITYNKHIKELFARRCDTCHTQGGTHEFKDVAMGAAPLENYAQVKQYLNRIQVRVVEQKTMPFGNNITQMTEVERLAVKYWIEQGGLQH